MQSFGMGCAGPKYFGVADLPDRGSRCATWIVRGDFEDGFPVPGAHVGGNPLVWSHGFLISSHYPSPWKACEFHAPSLTARISRTFLLISAWNLYVDRSTKVSDPDAYLPWLEAKFR